MKIGKFPLYLLVIFAIIITCSAAVQASQEDQVNVTGKWAMLITTLQGSGNCVFTLKQDGNTLAGNYSCFFGKAPLFGTVNGNDIEIKYTLHGRFTTYKGKVDGNKISGTVNIGQGEATGTFEGTTDFAAIQPQIDTVPIQTSNNTEDSQPRNNVAAAKPKIDSAAAKPKTVVNVTGRWILSVTTPRGSGNPVLTLKQDGNNLTGTYSGAYGEAPITGTIKDKIFEVEFTLLGRHSVYKGKVAGKKMSGTVNIGDGEITGTFDGTTD